MASLIFAQAKSIRNKAKKLKARFADDPEFANKTYESIIKIEKEEFREILMIAKELHEVYTEVTGLNTKPSYFITIRPREEITFKTFHDTVCKFMKRKIFINWTLSYEQKSIEGNGEGFHVHIVANTTHRSKGECLRDTQSTFKDIADHNCIQVDLTYGPETLIQNYLVDYKADDNHKECTQNGDRIWREKNKIQHLYTNIDELLKLFSPRITEPVLKDQLALSIKSNDSAILINRSGPTIVELM